MTENVTVGREPEFTTDDGLVVPPRIFGYEMQLPDDLMDYPELLAHHIDGIRSALHAYAEREGAMVGTPRIVRIMVEAPEVADGGD